MTEENKYEWTEVSEKIDTTREEVLSNLKKAPFSSHNKSLWWKSIGWYFGAVNSGHISGEWAEPTCKGWVPPRITNAGEILPDAHHG